MEFYHNITTEKSFKLLKELKKNHDFVLIGGWAIFLYSHSLKSKDIDIILDYPELAKIKEDYSVFKNDRLKKYEIKQEEVDVDIYLPYYSDLGIEVEKIRKRTVIREGFILPEMEILLFLKLYAWQNRLGSIKGQKDEVDIFSLISLSEFNWQKYLDMIKEFGLEKEHQNFINLIKGAREVKMLEINEQKMSRIRKNILEIFNKK